jgi:hypothetical protein
MDICHLSVARIHIHIVVRGVTYGEILNKNQNNVCPKWNSPALVSQELFESLKAC